jgi:hypothetical protein
MPNPPIDADDMIEVFDTPMGEVNSLTSIAISLKRIADALDRITTPGGIGTLVTDLRPLFEAMQKEST